MEHGGLRVPRTAVLCALRYPGSPSVPAGGHGAAPGEVRERASQWVPTARVAAGGRDADVEQHTGSTSVASHTTSAARGRISYALVELTASGDAEQAEARLREALDAHGLTLFARVDHAAGARKAGVELAPNVLLIFGNPIVGTPLMMSPSRRDRTAAANADLAGPRGDTCRIPRPPRARDRYRLDGHQETLERQARVLAKVAAAAAGCAARGPPRPDAPPTAAAGLDVLFVFCFERIQPIGRCRIRLCRAKPEPTGRPCFGWGPGGRRFKSCLPDREGVLSQIRSR